MQIASEDARTERLEELERVLAMSRRQRRSYGIRIPRSALEAQRDMLSNVRIGEEPETMMGNEPVGDGSAV